MAPAFTPEELAAELAAAYAERRAVTPPSKRDDTFDIDAAYAVEAVLARMRRLEGRTTAGLKVGYANKAMWRALKLDTLVWAHMYDDTVHNAPGNAASLPLGRMYSPKIEPEIVFKLSRPVDNTSDAAAILDCVEWLALGFEIIDCIFPEWQFQPADFVAAYGLHAALVVGEPLRVEPQNAAALAEKLPRFKLLLKKDGVLVEEGSGRNSLRSPALCLGELSRAVRERGQEPLAAGSLISSGTLTTPAPIAPGQEWTAEAEELGLPKLLLRTA